MTFFGFEKNKDILNGKKLFLVCGRSFEGLDIASYINSLNPVKFSGFTSNHPTEKETHYGTEKFIESGCDTILAVGGGSAMDVAKCIKYYSGCTAELIAVPTTSGTGSEATHFAVEYRNGAKYSLKDSRLQPDYAILEPSVLKTVNEYTRKSTMLDAVCHLVESSWSVRATEESRAYSQKAAEYIKRGMTSYLANEDAGNEIMLNAANLAGKAINLTTTTAAHAMCYKLAELYHLQHGHAAALCLESLWRYLAEINSPIADIPPISYGEYGQILKGLSLKPVHIDETDIDTLVKSVNAERLGNFPMILEREIIRELYYGLIVREYSHPEQNCR